MFSYWKYLYVLLAVLPCLSACSPKGKLLGEWRWAAHEMTTEYAATHDGETLQKLAEMHTFYKPRYYKYIGLNFTDDSAYYEQYVARGIDWGYYELKGRKLAFTEKFLKHDPGQIFKITRIAKDTLVLLTEKMRISFSRHMDPEFEAEKGKSPAELYGRWTNKKNMGSERKLVVFDIDQSLDTLSGQVRMPTSMKSLKSTSPLKFTGRVAGNIAKIVIHKEIQGQSAYQANSYEYRGVLKDEILQLTFVRQRYLDDEGKLVEFFGNIDPPLPFEIELRYK